MGALTYQWQTSTDGGVTWTNSGMTGSTTATFQPGITAKRVNYLFRCVVNDGNGGKPTDAVRMIIGEAVK